jgi:hypothetical protein
MHKHHILLAALLLLSVATFAQKNLPTESVDVIKQFNARLIDAERFVVPPVLPNVDTSNRRQFYNILARPLNITYPAPKIRPLEWRNDPAGDVYKTYLQGGMGFPRAFYFDGSHDFVTKENLNIGVDVNHYSADNSKNLENQRFGSTQINGNAIFKTDQGFSVLGNVGYKTNTLYFYGYNDLDDDFPTQLSYAAEDVKQRFNTFYADAKIYNSEPTVLDFNYNASVDLYAMEDNYAARETGFNLALTGTKWFDKKHPLSVTLQTDFTGYEDTTSQSLNNFFLKPNFGFHSDRFRFRIGANIASHADEFYIYPDLEASVNVVDNLITAFAGIEGGLQKNNFRNLTDYNPFLSSRVDIRNSFYTHFFGGIKGEFKGIKYRGQAGFKNVDNLALYVTNGDSIPRFNVLYDTANIVTISGEISTQLFDNLGLIAAFSQNIFDLQREDKAWHLPAVTLNLGAVLTLLDDKLKVRGDLFLQNGVPARTSDGKSRSLTPLYDVSAGAEYQLTDNIGLFARVNNMLNNRRERWQHYPVLGLNGLVGLTARF